MQKGAQYQAVLEILDKVLQSNMPADVIVNNYLKNKKYIGSKDRKFITDTFWNIVRNKMKLSFDCKSENARDILLTYLKNENLDVLCGVSEYSLSPLTNAEKTMLKNLSEEVYPPYVEAEMPEWLYKKINNDALCKALNVPATADFRVNLCNRDDSLRFLQTEGLYFSKTPYSPIGLRSHERININNCIAYQEGKIEIQDEASQIVSILIDVKEKDKVVDYCAGAGGKSLAIGSLLNNHGLIFAHDVNKNRIKVLPDRMRRLNIKNIVIKDDITDCNFDKFIIDAPCSGTGTFRRSPDAKFRLNSQKITELNKIQSEILDFAYSHTKNEGEIIYITCSVLADENENIINDFLCKHPNCTLVNLKQKWQEKIGNFFPFDNDFMLHFSPLTTQTDGFFIAIIKCK